MEARRAGVWMLLFVLCTGCAGGPTVRLRTAGGGPVRTHAPRSWDGRVPISARDFEAALSRLALDVPLTVRPSRTGRVVRAKAGEGALLDQGLGFLLRDRYGKWCRAHEAPVDCLSFPRRWRWPRWDLPRRVDRRQQEGPGSGSRWRSRCPSEPGRIKSR